MFLPVRFLPKALFFFCCVFTPRAQASDTALSASDFVRLYESLIESLEELEEASPLNHTNLTGEGLYFVNAESRIPFNHSAFSNILTHSLTIYFHHMQIECPSCQFQYTETTIRKNLMRAIETKTLWISGQAIELGRQYGLPYLIYTGVTEFIESLFLGPGHILCPFFQWLYFPFAVTGNQLWGISSSRATGIPLPERVRAAFRSAHWNLKFRWHMRKVIFEDYSVLKRSDYKKILKEKAAYIETYLSETKLWPQSAAFFSRRAQSGAPSTPTTSLSQDIEYIFSNQRSAHERFFIAERHLDGLEFLKNLLSDSLDAFFVEESIDSALYFKYKGALGQLGKSLIIYKNYIHLHAVTRQTPSITSEAQAKVLLASFIEIFSKARDFLGDKEALLSHASAWKTLVKTHVDQVQIAVRGKSVLMYCNDAVRVFF